MKTIVVAVMLTMGFAASASEIPKDHPCKDIKAACEAAGFQKGHHKEGKGLWIDCLKKLKAGESVPGVTVSADQVSACKAKMEAKGKTRGTK